MDVIRETTATPAVPRPLEEIEREVATIPARRAGFERGTVEPLRAAVAAEKQTYDTGLVAAVRTDRTRPSRESLDKAEAALRRAAEELTAFDQIVKDLAQERQRAIDRQKCAERDANAQELARRRAESAGLKAVSDAAFQAVEANEMEIMRLLSRNRDLVAQVGPA
jgi:hypothetical protein